MLCHNVLKSCVKLGIGLFKIEIAEGTFYISLYEIYLYTNINKDRQTLCEKDCTVNCTNLQKL
jgi:hypothetical protein